MYEVGCVRLHPSSPSLYNRQVAEMRLREEVMVELHRDGGGEGEGRSVELMLPPQPLSNFVAQL